MTDITTKLAEALRLLVAAHELGVFLARGGLEPAREVLRLYEQAKAQPVQDLPPLPIEWRKVEDADGVEVPVFRAFQMRDYERAGYIAGLEAAASAIEPKCDPEDWTEYAGDCASLARVIRNLKGKA